MTAIPPTIAHIQRVVAQAFGVDLRDMRGKRQHRDVARPRQVAMYIAYHLTGRTSAEIARMFLRDRTTVQHSVDLIENLRSRDPGFKAVVQACIDGVGDINQLGQVEAAELIVRELMGELRPKLLAMASNSPTELLARLKALTEEPAPCA